MANSNPELGGRIRDIRRRHFAAPGGKAEIARRLQIDAGEYERYERGEVPPGELLVRLCEVTGEDLQWLLTGVASRGTVVIAGAKNRHQALLTQIARMIDERPALAAPIEAFVELLTHTPRQTRELPDSPLAPSNVDAGPLIPVLEADELPDEWPPDDGGGLRLAREFHPAQRLGESRSATLLTTHSSGQSERVRDVAIVSLAQQNGSRREFVLCEDLAAVAPRLFAVRGLTGPGTGSFSDKLVVSSPDCAARLGAIAVCKCAGRPAFCRIWLGGDEGEVRLGRAADGAIERVPRGEFRWASEALFWVASAA